MQPSNLEKSILVVDDDEVVRSFIQTILMRWGYQVRVAASGTAGLAIYKQCQPEIDLVLLDMNMPGMSGAELYEALLHWNPCIKCIMVSGDACPHEIETLKQKGLLGYISKPFTIDVLASQVETVLTNAAPVVKMM